MHARVMALVVGLAACSDRVQLLPDAKVVDANLQPRPDSWTCGGDGCNVLAQTGCCAGYRCTWLVDQFAPPIGHFDCPPVATNSVPAGGDCFYGVHGDDNCAPGNVCQDGVCKVICDPNGGSPSCRRGYACTTHESLFGPTGGPKSAGTCDRICAPPLARCEGTLPTG